MMANSNLPTPIIDELWQHNGVYDRITEELRSAVRKHGLPRTPLNPDKSLLENLAILVEEVGEIARAICDISFNQEARLRSSNLEEELIQTAAMSVAILVGLKLAKKEITIDSLI